MSDFSARSGSRQISLAPAILLCAILAGIEAWWRFVLYHHSPVGVGFSLPILIVGWTRRRGLLWGMCAIFACMTLIKFSLNHPTNPLPIYKQIAGVLMFLVDLLILTGIVDLALRREFSFLAGAEKLHNREQELKISNEGLLERQQTMDVLLKLSRSLTVGLSRDEMVSAIARTIRLLLGETVATAIWNRKDRLVEMLGHEGFGKSGPQTVTADLDASFAGLVIQKQQTLAIPNMSQQSEAKIERNGDGMAFQAMLGAPLRSGSEVVGALVMYSPQSRSWTESDLSLVESLAAQASVSIAATRLLEQSENEHRELQTIVDAVPFGILRADARASKLTCNPAAAAMLGFPEVVEADSKDWPRMTLIGPKGEIPPGRTPLERALHGEVTAAMELDLRLGPSETMTILCNAAPIRDRSGAITGAISAFVDVSIVKSLRGEMVNRQRLSDAASLHRARFLQAVSHGIRTPANAVNLLTVLLRKTVAEPAQSDEVPEICRELEQCSTGMVNLVTDVIDLVRLDLGRVELNETEIELGLWIEEQCKQFSVKAREKGLRFTCDVREPGIRLRTDKIKLARVMNCLIGNAIRYTAKGEINVEADVLDDRTLRFDVSDTGIGIPPEKQQEIFDELVQIKSPERNKSSGTGLGLAISRRLLQLMGGRLDVASEPGKGSTFTFFLPSSKVIR
jgi:signal transduction histidine kinase